MQLLGGTAVWSEDPLSQNFADAVVFVLYGFDVLEPIFGFKSNSHSMGIKRKECLIVKKIWCSLALHTVPLSLSISLCMYVIWMKWSFDYTQHRTCRIVHKFLIFFLCDAFFPTIDESSSTRVLLPMLLEMLFCISSIRDTFWGLGCTVHSTQFVSCARNLVVSWNACINHMLRCWNIQHWWARGGGRMVKQHTYHVCVCVHCMQLQVFSKMKKFLVIHDWNLFGCVIIHW